MMEVLFKKYKKNPFCPHKIRQFEGNVMDFRSGACSKDSKTMW